MEKNNVSTSSQRKVIYSMMVSLDGFIESSTGEINWSAPDEELHQHFNDQEHFIDTHLYGRRLYENMANYWPTADQKPDAPELEIEFARIWKKRNKVVFSKTLEHVDWNTTLVRENIAEEVRKLKEQPGKDMDLGGAELAATFRQLDLIDEYRLYIHPVLLGDGKPMFKQLPEMQQLHLIESKTFGCGVVLLRYQPLNRIS